MAEPFVLIDGTEARSVDARISAGRVRLTAGALERGLGWTLKPEGLCRGSVCIPAGNGEAWIDDAGIDLEELARALDRPLAIDVDERAAALGTSAGERANQLASLEAPDIELPDLDGRRHRLSAHRGKKVLLIVYASW